MDVPATMRAFVLTGHGGIDRLQYRERHPVPRPGPGEVLVAVSACGVNNTDINTRVGWYAGGSWGGGVRFPLVQGADPVGVVAAVGDSIPSERIGQRVLVDPWLRGESLEEARYLGSEADGGFAEYVVVPSINAHEIGWDLDDLELAGFACSYSTAEHMLTRAGLEAGQSVLVTGASGGVGTALIQLAKVRGANVVALTSRSKMEAVAALGADVVLDRAADDLAETVAAAVPDGIDVFADVVGGEGFPPLFERIRRGGHYVVAGAVAGPQVTLDLRTLYLHDLTMHGATVVPREVFTRLVGLIAHGRVRPVIDRSFPLEELPAAQEHFLTRSHVGSVVIDVGRP